MSGKVGNIVVTSRGGEVIAREYNPKVANPNTTSQQTTRSKFKLASQLSAALSTVIAIKKQGNVSARNQFVQENYDAISFSMGQASINLNVVQLTKSRKSFAGFNADRTGGTAIAVELNADSAAQLSRVVYVAYKKGADLNLEYFDSKVCNVAGADGKFADVLRYTADSVVLYAYGMKDIESGITTKFGNMQAPTAEDVANLLVSNTDNMQSVQLTKTAGLTMAEGENTGDSDDTEHLSVSLVISGNGSATGGGRFEAGQQATLRATPDAEASFVAWKANNASGAVLSTANPYTFTVEDNVTICAVFEGGPTPQYNIALSADPANGGTVSGGGTKAEGSSCTVVATPAEGKVFDGWFENGQLVSNSASYTFTVSGARTLVAHFGDAPEGLIESIKVNGTDITNNDYASDTASYVGAFASAANGKTFACDSFAAAPQVGQQITNPYRTAVVTSGAATISGLREFGQAGDRDYFFIGTANGNVITVEEVFPVSLMVQTDD